VTLAHAPDEFSDCIWLLLLPMTEDSPLHAN
jgi:hypothetical protein